MREHSSFWQFSDQLCLQTAGVSSLSIAGDSIWSDPILTTKKPEERIGLLDLNLGGWKMGSATQKLAFANITTSRYNNSSNYNDNNICNNNGSNFKTKNSNSYNGEVKNYYEKEIDKPVSKTHGNNKKSNDGKSGGGKKNSCFGNSNSCNSSTGNGAVDKRFKTLPPSESLPRSEAVGGYIFVCNNDTMQENLQRQLFGLTSRYRDSVRAITPGLPLFLYNYSTHQLNGIFEAASFGGANIDPTAWEDKNSNGESRFPAQVRVVSRKICEPLEEDSFRPILHHYDGSKFRLELSVPEAISLLDVFSENNS